MQSTPHRLYYRYYCYQLYYWYDIRECCFRITWFRFQLISTLQRAWLSSVLRFYSDPPKLRETQTRLSPHLLITMTQGYMHMFVRQAEQRREEWNDQMKFCEEILLHIIMKSWFIPRFSWIPSRDSLSVPWNEWSGESFPERMSGGCLMRNGLLDGCDGMRMNLIIPILNVVWIPYLQRLSVSRYSPFTNTISLYDFPIFHKAVSFSFCGRSYFILSRLPCTAYFIATNLMCEAKCDWNWRNEKGTVVE